MRAKNFKKKDNIAMVVIIGPVGSGKTTVSRIIKKYYEKKYKVYYSGFKINHLTSFLLIYIVYNLLFPKNKSYLLNGYKKGVGDPLKKLIFAAKGHFEKISLLWCILEIINFEVLYTIKIRMKKILGDIIIIEDFIHGALVDYFYIYKKISNNRNRNCFLFLIKYIYIRIIKQRSILFFIDADLKTLVSRWRKRKTASEFIDYVVFQKIAYKKLFSNYRISFNIDTTKMELDKLKRVIENTLKKIPSDK